MGSYLLTLFFFCNFRGKEYYFISLRSIQTQIFCLWLKYVFFVNSKHYSRSNGTKGNFKLRKDLLLNSVLQALLSVTCFSAGLAGSQHNRRNCTSSSTGLENVFNVILARQNSAVIDTGREDIKSQQTNNINLSVNCVLNQVLFLMDNKIRHKCRNPLIYS